MLWALLGIPSNPPPMPLNKMNKMNKMRLKKMPLLCLCFLDCPTVVMPQALGATAAKFSITRDPRGEPTSKSSCCRIHQNPWTNMQHVYYIYCVYIYVCIIMHIISYSYEYIGHASLSSLLVSQRITLCGFETFGYPFRVRGKAEDQHGNMKLFNLHYFRRMSKPVCLGLR